MDVAEDIAQDIFVRLWEKNNHFENYLALKSYLYLSARNSCLNYIKHHNIVLEHAQTQKTKEKGRNRYGRHRIAHHILNRRPDWLGDAVSLCQDRAIQRYLSAGHIGIRL